MIGFKERGSEVRVSEWGEGGRRGGVGLGLVDGRWAGAYGGGWWCEGVVVYVYACVSMAVMVARAAVRYGSWCRVALRGVEWRLRLGWCGARVSDVRSLDEAWSGVAGESPGSHGLHSMASSSSW